MNAVRERKNKNGGRKHHSNAASQHCRTITLQDRRMGRMERTEEQKDGRKGRTGRTDGKDKRKERREGWEGWKNGGK